METFLGILFLLLLLIIGFMFGYERGLQVHKRYLERKLKEYALTEFEREIIEKIEVVFDDYRSSNQKLDDGSRRFGVAGFEISARQIHDDIISQLEKEKRT